HAEPDEIDAELFGDGSDERHDDEGKLEEVEKEREHEDDDVDDDEKAELPAGQAGQQMLDPHVTIDAVERQAEDASADEDEDDERRQLGRRVHRLPKQMP